MHEVDWIPGIAALVVGLVIGSMAALRARQAPGDAVEGTGRTKAEARAIRIEDLRQRKEQLLQQIRDCEDTDLAGGISAAADERAALEVEAARVLRELHHLEGRQQTAGGESGAPSGPPDAGGGMSGQLKGALTGGAVVAFGFLLFLALQDNTGVRTGDMPMTGGDAAGSAQTANLPPPGAGRPGDPVPGVPPSLQPKASPRVDAARAKVAASPNDRSARAELGWALIDAEGWIDVFNNAEQLLELDPGNPDGLTQKAVVRMRMGQSEVAETLVDQALSADPEHGRALAWKGTLRWQAGDRGTAKAVWEKGAKLHPDGGFDSLVAMANGELPASALGDGEVGESTQPATQASAKPAPVTGTVVLPDEVPAGAVLFVYARPAGQAAGPPLAAVRSAPKPGANPFSVGPDDVIPMMRNRPFPSSIQLSARLDLDGNAGTKDGPTASMDDVAAGTTGVTLTVE